MVEMCIFFSANNCWWQIRFENNNRTMICYKSEINDPVTTTDPSRASTLWFMNPPNRPENSLTRVSFRYGGQVESRPMPEVGFNVHFSKHWVFDDTGLDDDDVFGENLQIVGYECDGVRFEKINGVPYVIDELGQPNNFVILAKADLTDPRWQPGQNGFPVGSAVIGMYKRNGIVFTSGTTDWNSGLRFDDEWNEVSQITLNLLSRLSAQCSSSFRIKKRGFERPISNEWYLEDSGGVRREYNIHLANSVLVVDATGGRTWISQGPFYCQNKSNYKIGCWTRANLRGATLKLQSMNILPGNIGGVDFVVAEHSGNGQWEYIQALGRTENESPLFPARIKIEVEPGWLRLLTML
jgi:hypothetical protein